MKNVIQHTVLRTKYNSKNNKVNIKLIFLNTFIK